MFANDVIKSQLVNFNVTMVHRCPKKTCENRITEDENLALQILQV